MKVIFALMLGLAAGFFFGRAGTLPVKNPPLGVAAPAPVDGAGAPPLPSPMSNPGPRPTWKARIESMSDATDRRQLLSELSEKDIEQWRVIQRDRAKDFLKTASEYWRAGLDGNKVTPGRNDLSVLKAALGTYEGIMRYDLREGGKGGAYKFRLALNDAEGRTKNSLTMESVESPGSSSMKAEFFYEFLGAEGREVNVVWENFNGNEAAFLTHFAFRLRSGMVVGEKETVRLMGLSPDRKWTEIGNMELKRAK
jgi:hypothetical protein